jgi:hypothetical protein
LSVNPRCDNTGQVVWIVKSPGLTHGVPAEERRCGKTADFSEKR